MRQTIVSAEPRKLRGTVKTLRRTLIREENDKATIITTPWDEINGKQILKVIESQDTMESELIAEAYHREEEEYDIIMTTNIIMSMSTVSASSRP